MLSIANNIQPIILAQDVRKAIM